MKINNLLSLCFISLFIISASSCKKDTPKKAVTATDISGTTWVYSGSYTFLGNTFNNATVTVKFTSATAGSFVASIPATDGFKYTFTYAYSNWSGEITLSDSDKTKNSFTVDSATKSTLTYGGAKFTQQ